jgi:hypothetical protein
MTRELPKRGLPGAPMHGIGGPVAGSGPQTRDAGSAAVAARTALLAASASASARRAATTPHPERAAASLEEAVRRELRGWSTGGEPPGR